MSESVSSPKPANDHGKVCPKCYEVVDWKVILRPRLLPNRLRCSNCASSLHYENNWRLSIYWNLVTFLIIVLYVVAIKYGLRPDSPVAMICIGSGLIGGISEILNLLYKRRHLTLVATSSDF